MTTTLEQNIRGLCDHFQLNFTDFMADLEVDDVQELTLYDLQAICDEYKLDLLTLLFKNAFRDKTLKNKLNKIKLLILDVDGVLTDGGMYYSESGDQFKKFNTKDGMAIMALKKVGIETGIISSGFRGEAVKQRAQTLGIERCYVGRDEKMEILKSWLAEMNLNWEQVGIIGDDINDMPLMRAVGFAACPSDAVVAVKSIAHLVLQSKGGQGCVREFIDHYILAAPLEK